MGSIPSVGSIPSAEMSDPMTQLPAGFTERPVRPDDDLAAVVDLSNAAAIAEYGVPDVDERLMREAYEDRKSTRLNSSHSSPSRMPSSA